MKYFKQAGKFARKIGNFVTKKSPKRIKIMVCVRIVKVVKAVRQGGGPT